jgi:hypothetical protein
MSPACCLTLLAGGAGRGILSGERKVLRGGPAPLTLVSLGRWASVAAAAGNPYRGLRACAPTGAPRMFWSVLKKAALGSLAAAQLPKQGSVGQIIQRY